jgi:hypothetical protein
MMRAILTKKPISQGVRQPPNKMEQTIEDWTPEGTLEQIGSRSACQVSNIA